VVPFHQLQQRLLHALARDVAGDRGIVRLAADLVDLVDIDDAALRPLDIVVGGLEQLQDDVLDILADIAGLGQRRRVGHGERHVEDAGERLREQVLPQPSGRPAGCSTWPARHRALGAVREALVVIVDGDGEHSAWRASGRSRNRRAPCRSRPGSARRRGLHERRLGLLANDVVAQFDAFIADEHGRAGDQLAHLVLRLAAERAIQCAFRVAAAQFRHISPSGRQPDSLDEDHSDRTLARSQWPKR
jgi:hypothetical protein